MSTGLEALRQQALLAALAIPCRTANPAAEIRGSGARIEQGLAAYRTNGSASAERALAAVFGTVQAMLGADDFRQLAREFWRAHPPQRGDLGEWGAALPDWLAAHAQLAAWPYLADSARLDLARHDCERAADAALDAASLSLLDSAEPVHLRLQLIPGMALLRSPWPIAAIHSAHWPQANIDTAFAAVRDALAAQRGDTVLVARCGWRAEVHLLNVIEARWMSGLLAGVSLADALDLAGADFNFGAWLAVAVREPWLEAVTVSVG